MARMRWAIALAVITALEGCAVAPYTVNIGEMVSPTPNSIVERYGVSDQGIKTKRTIRGRWGEFKGTLE